jgi:hypothetical protein
MKYKINDVLFNKFEEKNQKGRVVLDVKENRGMWNMPCYRFDEKNIKSGYT